MSEQLNLSFIDDSVDQDSATGPSKKSKPLKRQCRRGHPEIYDEVKKPHSFYLPRTIIDAVKFQALRRGITPSELIETAIRTIDISTFQDSVSENLRQDQRRLSTSYALTKTAVNILIDLQREHQLPSRNAAAARVISHLVSSSETS